MMKVTGGNPIIISDNQKRTADGLRIYSED